MITEPLTASTAQDGATHHRWREGAQAGLLAVAVGAMWSLGVDIAYGHPFRTWRFIGYGLISLTGPSPSAPPVVAVAVFFVFVALVFMLVGRVAVAAAHHADTQPSLMVFGTTVISLVTLALVQFTTALTTSSLGLESWLQIFGSTLIALWTVVFRVYRTHPSLARDFQAARDA